MTQKPDLSMAKWILVDGSGRTMRAWAMDGTRAVATLQAPAGTSLADLTKDWGLADDMPLIACGMDTAALAPVPAKVLDLLPEQKDQDPVLLPGLKQPSPPAEMRGGETRIAGFLTLNPGWDGVICLTGARSHWAEVSAGEVVSFQTFLTGEKQDALLASPSFRALPEVATDSDAFTDALNESLSRPEQLAAKLAGLTLLPPEVARARLAGLLIGAELAAARPYWLGRQIAVIGPDGSDRDYARALEAQGVPVTRTDESAMTLAGLIDAARRLKGP